MSAAKFTWRDSLIAVVAELRKRHLCALATARTWKSCGNVGGESQSSTQATVYDWLANELGYLSSGSDALDRLRNYGTPATRAYADTYARTSFESNAKIAERATSFAYALAGIS